MLLRRLVAIAFILACTSVAWFILAATITNRTYRSDDKLRSGVTSIWGTSQEQSPPSATFEKVEEVPVQSATDGHKTTRLEQHRYNTPLTLETSRIDVSVALEHRQKGLLWYSTYVVNFDGSYSFRNPLAVAKMVTFRLTFPAEQAIYDGLVMEVDGRPALIASDKKGASVQANLGPEGAAVLRIAYRSRGLESWRYRKARNGGRVDPDLAVQ